MSNHEKKKAIDPTTWAGNQPQYDSCRVEKMENSMLEGKHVLFLGSSVTYGAASLQDGIPEYFHHRFGCIPTKEAVSGTTLVDNGPKSYVSRLLSNVSVDTNFSLAICQLSTNDATKGLPLGEIGEGKERDSFDTQTITGAMEYIIAYCKEKWNCPMMFYTGSHYASENYEAMVQRLYQLAEKWNLGVLDLWKDADFNAISDEDRKLYMYDPIHPTKAGYMKWWCPEMEKQLLALKMV